MVKNFDQKFWLKIHNDENQKFLPPETMSLFVANTYCEYLL